jgi:glycosyltransferase involved in cell wall biosynthesis
LSQSEFGITFIEKEFLLKSPNAPLVSVVMPVYNAEKTLLSALESVLQQSYSHLELIVVNDGSTDRSSEIIHNLKDPRIRYFEKKNGGTASAQNLGFAQIRGDYVALHDSDDLWKKNKLEKHVNHLETRPDVDVSYSYSQMMDERAYLLKNCQKPKLQNVTLKDVLCHHVVGNGSNALFRARLLRPFSEKSLAVVNSSIGPSHDVEMWVHITYLSRAKFEGLAEVLNYYRISSSSYSANLRNKAEDYEKVFKAIAVYSPETVDSYGDAARAFHYRYLARRALVQGEALEGCRFLAKAFRLAPLELLTHDFLRTLSTLTGNLVFLFLPHPIRIKLVRTMLSKSHQASA